jgi:hypothetical protein
MLDCITAELKMTVLQMASSTFTIKTQGSIKSLTCEADDHFGVQCPKCSCVSSHSTGSNCECTILQIISVVPPTSCSLGEVSKLVENAVTLHDNTTAHSADTVENVH